MKMVFRFLARIILMLTSLCLNDLPLREELLRLVKKTQKNSHTQTQTHKTKNNKNKQTNKQQQQHLSIEL